MIEGATKPARDDKCDNGGMGEPPHPPTVFYVTQRWDSNDNKETSEVFVLSICSMVPEAHRDWITAWVTPFQGMQGMRGETQSSDPNQVQLSWFSCLTLHC